MHERSTRFSIKLPLTGAPLAPIQTSSDILIKAAYSRIISVYACIVTVYHPLSMDVFPIIGINSKWLYIIRSRIFIRRYKNGVYTVIRRWYYHKLRGGSSCFVSIHNSRPVEMAMHLAVPIPSLKEKLAKSEIDIIEESESPPGSLFAFDPVVNQLMLRFYATSDGPQS